MLRNVLVDYLDGIREREFDLPFLALLPAMGFYDVHFTHGSAEFGKDFIAKRQENGGVVQYSFQSKAGDIGQNEWRNVVMGQLLEFAVSELSHPSFDATLPHQTVLVTTGRLTGNTGLCLQDLNQKLKGKFGERPAEVWDRETLVSHLQTFGLFGVYGATASDLISFGNFLVLYGTALRGSLSERDIERHSRRWLDLSPDASKRLLCATIEAELIGTQCIRQGLLYEAIHAYLSGLRAVLHVLHQASNSELVQLQAVYAQAMARLYDCCRSYLMAAVDAWEAARKDLVAAAHGPDCMVAYPVNCARIMETAGYLYFMEQDSGEVARLASFIGDFTQREIGCAHAPSDRYAVSLVLPVLALYASGQSAKAIDLLRRATIWLCDRYQEGDGLAPVDADPYEETATLLGWPFEFFHARKHGGSFLASVISDLAAFLANERFYSDVVNDIKASGIVPQYWQVPDTDSLFRVDGLDVATCPSVEYADALTEFASFGFANHVTHEPRSFGIAQRVGPLGLVILMLLLRDRYFPTQWPLLIAEHSRCVDHDRPSQANP